jgi:peptide deformylase
VPDPILRRICAPFTAAEIFSTDARKLARDMTRALTHPTDGGLRAVGIAAPQIGIDKRVCVVTDQPRGLPTLVMFNPKLTLLDAATTTTVPEACLSIPDTVGPVTRPSRVRVDFVDEAGKQRDIELHGYWASVAQHEIDHLDGILFTDKVDRDARGRELLCTYAEFSSDDTRWVTNNADGWARMGKKMYTLIDTDD